MQSLKGFTKFTKTTLDYRDAYAIIENAKAQGFTFRLQTENAGSAVAHALAHRFRNKKILFICGTGGKGAIGLVAARHLYLEANVKVVLLGSSSAIRNETTREKYDEIKYFVDMYEIDEEDLSKLKSLIAKSEVIVEAILGLGLKGLLSGFASKVIHLINDSRKQIVSIDVPAGLNADTSMPNRATVKPDMILVVHKMKSCLAKIEECDILVIDVGTPPTAELFTGPGDVMLATEPRSLHGNKYTNGSVLVLGGSAVFHGAPVLASFAARNVLAALRTGAGYVTVVAPEEITSDISRMSPDLIVRGLDSVLGGAGISDFMRIRHDSILIGPGMNSDDIEPETMAALINAEVKRGNTVIVDALGIGVLAKIKSAFNRSVVLTPHDGEFAELTGKKLKNATLEERINTAIEFTGDRKCTLVLKGHDTIITDGRLLKINEAKTPTLAKMGTGDVLSGMIAAYASLHKDAFESAAAAVYVHSRIADSLYPQKGLHITPDDLIENIPSVLKEFDVIAK